jgi:two-component system LytT family response regulator
MNKLSCIIIEDEPLAASRIKEFISKRSELTLVGSFVDGLEALSYLSKREIDLVFLDINIGGISGIELLEKSKKKFRVIITSAYSEYALKGYELNVDDYLLKPFQFARFSAAVDRVLERLNDVVKPSISVKCENRLERIFIHEILFIEGMDDYRRIHLKDKRIMTLATFRQLEEMLHSSSMIRIHRSYMVNLQWVNSFSKHEVQINNSVFPVSDSYADSLKLLWDKFIS